MRGFFAFLFIVFSWVFIYLLVPDSISAITDPGSVGSAVPSCSSLGGACLISNVCYGSGGRIALFPTTGCTTTACCILAKCSSRGGTCASSKICKESGGTPISYVSGCGGSIPTCCKYQVNNECFGTGANECKNGEYCAKRSTGNVCLPKSYSSSGSTVVVRECTPPFTGCVSGYRCFSSSDGSTTCLPSDGACKAAGGDCMSERQCSLTTTNPPTRGFISSTYRCAVSGEGCCFRESLCSNVPGSRNPAGCDCGNSPFLGQVNVGCAGGLACFTGSEWITDYNYSPSGGFSGSCTPLGSSGGRGSGGGSYYVTGTVFLDTNSPPNGIKDNGEQPYIPPLGQQGASLSLIGPSTNVIATTYIRS